MSRSTIFLGFGARYRCDRCGKNIREDLVALCSRCWQVNPASIRGPYIWAYHTHRCGICHQLLSLKRSRQVCFSCATTHPDNTHGYRGAGASRGRLESTKCVTCGSMCHLHMSCDGTQATYLYSRVGCPDIVAEPFPCTGAKAPNQDGSQVCNHEYVATHDYRLAADPPPELNVERVLSFNQRLELQNRFGAMSVWCWKCGDSKIILPWEVGSYRIERSIEWEDYGIRDMMFDEWRHMMRGEAP